MRPGAEGKSGARAPAPSQSTADWVRTWAEAAEMRAAPLLVLDPLERFLQAHGFGEGPIAVTRIGGGHSNETFLVHVGATGNRNVVLRRPPRPPIPPSAHDVVREARILRALEPTEVPVPRVLAVCEDEGVIGAPFCLMEFVPGHVIEQDVPREFRATAERRRLANAFIDAVAAVHRVNLEKVGLAGLARPSGYLERQLRRFSGLWEHSKTREIPAMAALEDWLRRRRPESADTTLVHGDCRLGNAIVAARAPARIAALLDWEMATIGDPLADLGYFCASWSDPTDERLPKFHLSPATASAGFPTRTELLDRYERRTGRPIVDLQWYWALALWKSAVFMEGNVRRSNEGMTSDPLLRDFSDGVVELAELGLDVARSVN